MEDVLAVYTRAHDPDCPVVCLDETSKQLVAETRVPVPMKPGQPVRSDYEYERNGTANMFMMFAPLEGWRHVKVTDRHTAVELQSMAVGSIWPSPNSASFRPNASIAASQTTKLSSMKSPLGRRIETPTTPRPIGSSPHQKHNQTQASIPVNLTESGH
jgi:hypothetical protein